MMDKAYIRGLIEQIDGQIADSPIRHNGLLGGRLGLLFYQYHAARQGRVHLEQVFEDLNAGRETLAGSALGNGIAGFAWVTNEFNASNDLGIDIDEEFADLDDLLFDSAKGQIARHQIDYLHGASGVLHYFASRKQQPRINNYLNELVDALLEQVVVADGGCWFRNRLTEKEEGLHLIDFSLAHGLSGILLILLEALPYLRRPQLARQVVEKGIRFIIQHELPAEQEKGEYSAFPCSIDSVSKEAKRINRLAWCYGDLNHVLLLYTASRVLQDPRYAALAARLGALCIQRQSVAATLCSDTHFCHGTSGLARLYKSLYQLSGNRHYYQAYEYWIARTTGLLEGELKEGKYDENRVGLLEGLPGIALVLADSIGPDRANWKRVFLL